MLRSKLIYTAGAYTGPTAQVVRENINTAKSYAMSVWELGFTAICPHLNTERFEVDCGCNYEDYMRGDFEIINRVDALFMIPNWTHSKGAIRERLHAMNQDKPIFYNLEDLAEWGNGFKKKISS